MTKRQAIAENSYRLGIAGLCIIAAMGSARGTFEVVSTLVFAAVTCWGGMRLKVDGDE